MGQSFDSVPDAFARMKAEFEDDLVQWGAVDSRAEYIWKLASCDVALVTAYHDFFGISVLECAAVGLDVVAPADLAYTEHFGEDELHARPALLDAFLDSLSETLRGKWAEAAGRYGWPSVAQRAWGRLIRVWAQSGGKEHDAVHRT